MAASNKTAKEVFDIIKVFVPDADERSRMLSRLDTVKGNKSFETTIDMLLQLNAAHEEREDGDG